MEINAYYRSARLMPQGNTQPLFLINLGVRQELFHKKASLTLTVSDAFHSLKYSRRIDTPILYESATRKRNTQIVYLGFTYRSGQNSQEEKEEFKFEDEIK